MLTVKDAAALIPTSLSMLYQWVAEKRFNVYRVGGRNRRGKILIDETEFRAFLETLKVGAEQPPARSRQAALPPPEALLSSSRR